MFSRVYVEITNICNLRCSFCHGHCRAPGRMTPADFSRVLQQLAGKTEFLYYHLMGEPLTHPQLPQFLEMASQSGFRSVITTNGTLLRQKGQILIDAGVHKVNISLHSFETGEDADLARYVGQVADFAEKAAAAGILVSLRLWNQGVADTQNSGILSFLESRFPQPWTQNTRGYRIRDGLFLNYDARFDWPDRDARDQGSQVFCYGLKDHFGILCDGTVVPCCLDSDGVLALGNIFSEDIDEILSSKRARAMVTGFQNRNAPEDLCRRCGFARRFG